jgi:hypothetical protein
VLLLVPMNHKVNESQSNKYIADSFSIKPDKRLRSDIDV